MKLYLTDKEVAERYGLHFTTIWRWAKEKREDFPSPIKLGGHTARWALADLEEWEIKHG